MSVTVQTRCPLVIFGAQRFAELLRYRAEECGRQVLAFVVDQEYLSVTRLTDLEVLAFEDFRLRYPPGTAEVLSAVGYRSLRARQAVGLRIAEAGYRVATLVCPGATVAENAVIGDGSIVFPGTIVEPFVTVGSDNIVWPGSVICHHSTLGRGNYLAPGVIVAGNCTVGDLCFMGVRATLIDGVELGSECQLLPGSVLTENAAPFGVYGGVPARRVAHIDPHAGVCIAR